MPLESLLLLLHGNRRYMTKVDLIPSAKSLMPLKDVKTLPESTECLPVLAHAVAKEYGNLVSCTNLLVKLTSLGRCPLGNERKRSLRINYMLANIRVNQGSHVAKLWISHHRMLGHGCEDQEILEASNTCKTCNILQVGTRLPSLEIVEGVKRDPLLLLSITNAIPKVEKDLESKMRILKVGKLEKLNHLVRWSVAHNT